MKNHKRRNPLRTWRIENDLSQKEVAEKLHVSAEAVRLWEAGEAAPTERNLIKIARLTKIDIDTLATGLRCNRCA